VSAAPSGLAARLERFFFAPASERPLAVLRLTVVPILLVQALMIQSLVLELWASAGLMQASLGNFLTGGDMLWFTGIRGFFDMAGVPESLWIRVFYAAYVGSLTALIFLPRRPVALAACVLHGLLLAGGSLSTYGVDQFSQVALFTLVLCPGVPGRVSPDARFALRYLQGTLCLAYLGSGLAKARGRDWWTGDAIHRALTMPIYRTIDPSFMMRMPWIAKLFAWATLALEIGYPPLMFWKRTRMLCVIGIIGMHLGIFFFMRLYSFALVMSMLTFVAYGLSAEPPDHQKR
jgi:hypothetical protein